MIEQTLQFTVDAAGVRLDHFIVQQMPEATRSQIQAWIRDGHVTVDGRNIKAGSKLRGGEQIELTLPPSPVNEVMAEAIPLDILYEDDAIVVVNKAAGMVVHPGTGNQTGTLVNALLYRYPFLADLATGDGDLRMGIVHRLDKETSGLLVIAKTTQALDNVMAQFQDRTVEKVYLALTERTPKTSHGEINAPIARDPRQRKRMAVVNSGKSAVTQFEVIEDHFRDGQALLRINLLTGRTHQIRVHLAFIGCPIVGDRVYGFRKQRIKLKRNFLHATELSFDHPTTNERLHFAAPLPAGLQNILDKLRIKD